MAFSFSASAIMAFALVKHGEAGVDEEVVGVVLGGLLRCAERLVEVAQFLVAMRHRLVGVGKLRVEGDGLG